MTEASRAAEYRRQQAARARNKAAEERALAGNEAEADTVRDAWEPLLPIDADGVVRLGHDL